MPKFLIALSLAVIAGISLERWVLNDGAARRQAQELAGDFSERAILAKRTEIEALASDASTRDSWEGKILLALLACVGTRVDVARAETAPSPIPPRAAPATERLATGEPVAKSAPMIADEVTPLPSADAALGAGLGAGSTPASSSTPPKPWDPAGFFCKEAGSAPELVGSQPDWLVSHPNSGQTSAVRPDWGWLGTEPTTRLPMDAFVCAQPSFSPLTAQTLSRSQFFRRLGGRSFGLSGESPPGETPQFRMHVHFNAAGAAEADRIYFNVRGSRNTPPLENRYWRFGEQNPPTSIRWNSCSRAVSLLGQQCPWGDPAVYDIEYKDFVFFGTTGELGFNAYCRERKTGQWKRLWHGYLRRRGDRAAN